MFSVLLGIYHSAEKDTGAGAMIALMAALVFLVVVVSKSIVTRLTPLISKFMQQTND